MYEETGNKRSEERGRKDKREEGGLAGLGGSVPEKKYDGVHSLYV